MRGSPGAVGERWVRRISVVESNPPGCTFFYFFLFFNVVPFLFFIFLLVKVVPFLFLYFSRLYLFLTFLMFFIGQGCTFFNFLNFFIGQGCTWPIITKFIIVTTVIIFIVTTVIIFTLSMITSSLQPACRRCPWNRWPVDSPEKKFLPSFPFKSMTYRVFF